MDTDSYCQTLQLGGGTWFRGGCSFLGIFLNADSYPKLPNKYDILALQTFRVSVNAWQEKILLVTPIFFNVLFHSPEAKTVAAIIKIENGERRAISSAERCAVGT